MTDIPEPTEADLARDAKSDLEFMKASCNALGIKWLCRAVRAERRIALLEKALARCGEVDGTAETDEYWMEPRT